MARKDRALFPYQEEGARWLAENPRAGLFDSMGLGKTATLIRALNLIGARRILVVGPATLRENFILEWRMFSNTDLRLVKGRTVYDYVAWERGNFDVLVTSYELAAKWYALFAKNPGLLDALVLDEAHYLKSGSTQRTRALIGDGANGLDCWAQWAEYAWWSTGTPIPNHPMDAHTYLRFVGGFGGNAGKFAKTFFRESGGVLEVLEEKASEFRATMDARSLRRTKEGVGLQLPPIFLTQTLFEGDTSSIVRLVREHPGIERDILSALDAGGLQYIAAGHVATLRRLIGTAKAVPYAHQLADELINAPGKRVVFGIHKAALEIVKGVLERKGLLGYLVNGATSEALRTEAVREFQANPNCRFFIGQIRSAGTGLTLTAAHQIDMLESDWTPAGNAQAIMRVHRIGQEKKVHARFITLADTLDIVVNELLARKVRSIAEVSGILLEASPEL